MAFRGPYTTLTLIGLKLVSMCNVDKENVFCLVGVSGLTAGFTRIRALLRTEAIAIDGVTAVARSASLIHQHWPGS